MAITKITYEGDFVDGNYHGRGRWYRPDGTVEYEGNWMEKTWHGQGTLYRPNGAIERTGTWVHGEPAYEAVVD